MTEIRSFAGLTIDGEITENMVRDKQRPKEELAPILQALIDDEAIVSFGWTQYTPYFNDGEPCIFHGRSPWVGTKWDGSADDFDQYALEMTSSHPTLGNGERYDYNKRKYVPVDSPHFDQARYVRCRAMAEAIEGGEFDDALIELFGDHAEVTVSRDGIKVSFYEHA